MPVVTLCCEASPNDYTNAVYVHPSDAQALEADRMATPGSNREDLPAVRNYLCIRNFVFSYLPNDKITKGHIGIDKFHRQLFHLAYNDPVTCPPFVPTTDSFYTAKATLEVDLIVKKVDAVVHPDELAEFMRRTLNKQFLMLDQLVILSFNTYTLKLKTKMLECADVRALLKAAEAGIPFKGIEGASYGMIVDTTEFKFVKAQGSPLKFTSSESLSIDLGPMPEINAESLGIGGLDTEFKDIFRRAFVTRLFPAEFVAKLGVKHVKGMMLYGPPGTGKTLMATCIGKMFNGKEPKKISGPEILNKFVGQSEENIRLQFKDAIDDYKLNKERAELHIIIFDEIDSICRARGSTVGGSGVGDTVVNQLLAMIDGPEAIPNILVIGMTNRIDLIDEALLRPGRLEIHKEIGLPSEEGRRQIFRIHTNKMTVNGYLRGVDLGDLARRTKNFSGAEIEGIVKNAVSFALSEKVDPENLLKHKDVTNLAIEKQHFDAALKEAKPAFGVSDADLSRCMPNGTIPFGKAYQQVIDKSFVFIKQVQAKDTRTPLLSVLLSGPRGCGKSAISARIALNSEFPYIKMITAKSLVGHSEMGKSNAIIKMFEDAYKSPLSVIVIDDIERILDYVPVGPRFSNVVLQNLCVLLNSPPPKDHKLLIVGTTSNPSILKDLDLYDYWIEKIRLPEVTGPIELGTVLATLKLFEPAATKKVIDSFNEKAAIPIKRLIHECEVAKNAPQPVDSLIEQLYTYTTSLQENFQSKQF